MDVALFAVVPILPTLQAFTIILSIVGLSLLGALAALRHPATAVAIWRLAWRQRAALLVLGAVAVAVAVGIHSLASVRTGDGRGVAIDWPIARGGLARHGAAEDHH